MLTKDTMPGLFLLALLATGGCVPAAPVTAAPPAVTDFRRMQMPSPVQGVTLELWEHVPTGACWLRYWYVYARRIAPAPPEVCAHYRERTP